MKIFKKRCAYCKHKMPLGEEFSAEVKVPEFKIPKMKNFCDKEHYEDYLIENKGTQSKKPYCMNCDD